jgi:predicted transcriptional regulator
MRSAISNLYLLVAECKRAFGYTQGMKTAISIADSIFRKAEYYARRKKKSRSELYTEALSEYLARHDVDAVTEAMNKALEETGESVDPFVEAASQRALKRTQW